MAASGTEFLIEIEARMKAGAAISDLQALGEGLSDAKAKYAELSKSAEGTAKALEKVGGQLEAAKEKMAAAMKAGDTAAFWKAAGAANKLGEAETQLKAKAEATKAALHAQGAELGKMADKYSKLKKEEDGAKKNAEAVKKSFDGFRKLGSVGGPIGKIGGKIGDLKEAFAGLKERFGSGGASAILAAEGIATLTMAAVAAALVIVALGAAFIGFGISQANAQRDMKLTLQAMTGTQQGAAQLKDAFSEITLSTGIAGDRLLSLTRDLQKAKVSSADIPTALKAIAQQEAALGDSSGTAELIKNLETGKTTAQQLGADMDKQFGGIVEDKMLGLDQQMSTLKENVAGLFSDVDISGLLNGLKILVGLFDQNTVSGGFMKDMIGEVFGLFKEGSTDVAGAFKELVLGVELGVLKMVARLELLYDVITNLPTYFDLAKDAVLEKLNDWKEAGKNLIGGLVDGAKEKLDSFKNIVSDGIDNALSFVKKKKEIHSPSEEWKRELGAPLGAGAVQGVELQKPAFQRAVLDLVTMPAISVDLAEWFDAGDYEPANATAPRMPPSKTVAATSVQGGDTYNVEISIQIDGATDPEAVGEEVERRLDRYFRARAEQAGARRGKRRAA